MIDRAFISGITLGFLTAPLAANASGTARPQRESSAAKKAARIGVLYPGATTASSGATSMGCIGELTDGTDGSVDAVTWAGIGPYRKSRLRASQPKEETMRVIIRLVVIVTCFWGSLVAVPAHAQDGMKRTILNQADLSGAPGMEIISSILEVQPGTMIPRHFHNGIEAGRVLEGGMIQFPDKEPQMLATGTPIFQLRGAMHAGFKVVGDRALKFYQVHVVDKGKPLFDGVK